MKNVKNRNIEIFNNLGNLSKIKQREVFCPIANLRAITTPLLASDDLVLRTTISSVDTYDFELIKLIFKHVKFPDLEMSGQQFNLNAFLSNLSHVDKQVILWGIFASTYGTLGDQTLSCRHCKHDNVVNINLNDLIHDDSFELWGESVPFTDYIYPIPKIINIENIYSITFNTSLSTIRQHLDILALIPANKLKENFEKSGAIFSRAEELASVTRNIVVHNSVEDTEPAVFETVNENHSIISKFIPLDIIDDILTSYGDKFDKYAPKFKKDITCSNCGQDFTFSTDIEFSLFKRFLRR